jgi:hypothetical protein
MAMSSVLSELTSRSISFLMDKCSRQLASPPTIEETLSNLQRLLLQVHVIGDEADERHISNQAMLRQLNQLRKDMYRGYQTLDTFRCRVSPSFTPSIYRPAKEGHAQRVSAAAAAAAQAKKSSSDKFLAAWRPPSEIRVSSLCS